MSTPFDHQAPPWLDFSHLYSSVNSARRQLERTERKLREASECDLNSLHIDALSSAKDKKPLRRNQLPIQRNVGIAEGTGQRIRVVKYEPKHSTKQPAQQRTKNISIVNNGYRETYVNPVWVNHPPSSPVEKKLPDYMKFAGEINFTSVPSQSQKVTYLTDWEKSYLEKEFEESHFEADAHWINDSSREVPKKPDVPSLKRKVYQGVSGGVEELKKIVEKQKRIVAQPTLLNLQENDFRNRFEEPSYTPGEILKTPADQHFAMSQHFSLSQLPKSFPLSIKNIVDGVVSKPLFQSSKWNSEIERATLPLGDLTKNVNAKKNVEPSNELSIIYDSSKDCSSKYSCTKNSAQVEDKNEAQGSIKRGISDDFREEGMEDIPVKPVRKITSCPPVKEYQGFTRQGLDQVTRKYKTAAFKAKKSGGGGKRKSPPKTKYATVKNSEVITPASWKKGLEFAKRKLQADQDLSVSKEEEQKQETDEKSENSEPSKEASSQANSKQNSHAESNLGDNQSGKEIAMEEDHSKKGERQTLNVLKEIPQNEANIEPPELDIKEISYRRPTKIRRIDHATDPEKLQPKVRHYEPEVVREFMNKKNLQRKQAMLNERKLKAEMAKKRQERLQNLYDFQKRSAELSTKHQRSQKVAAQAEMNKENVPLLDPKDENSGHEQSDSYDGAMSTDDTTESQTKSSPEKLEDSDKSSDNDYGQVPPSVLNKENKGTQVEESYMQPPISPSQNEIVSSEFEMSSSLEHKLHDIEENNKETSSQENSFLYEETDQIRNIKQMAQSIENEVRKQMSVFGFKAEVRQSQTDAPFRGFSECIQDTMQSIGRILQSQQDQPVHLLTSGNENPLSSQPLHNFEKQNEAAKKIQAYYRNYKRRKDKVNSAVAAPKMEDDKPKNLNSLPDTVDKKSLVSQQCEHLEKEREPETPMLLRFPSDPLNFLNAWHKKRQRVLMSSTYLEEGSIPSFSISSVHTSPEFTVDKVSAAVQVEIRQTDTSQDHLPDGEDGLTSEEALSDTFISTVKSNSSPHTTFQSISSIRRKKELTVSEKTADFSRSSFKSPVMEDTSVSNILSTKEDTDRSVVKSSGEQQHIPETQMKYSPSTLGLKLSTELMYLENVNDSLLQLSELERIHGISLAQQETVAGVLEGRELTHKKEHEALVQASNQKIDDHRKEIVSLKQEYQKTLQETVDEAKKGLQDSAWKVMQLQAEAAKASAEAAKCLAESQARSNTVQQHSEDITKFLTQSTVAAASAIAASLSTQNIIQKKLKGSTRSDSPEEQFTSHTSKLSTEHSKDPVARSNSSSIQEAVSSGVAEEQSQVESEKLSENESSIPDVPTASSLSLSVPETDRSASPTKKSKVQNKLHRSQYETFTESSESVSEQISDVPRKNRKKYRSGMKGKSPEKKSEVNPKILMRQNSTTTSGNSTDMDLSSFQLSKLRGNLFDEGTLGYQSLTEFSLEIIHQLSEEERLRAQHHLALLRLQERTLVEKARAEIAWLDMLKRKCRETGAEDEVPALKKKQKSLLLKLHQKRVEIKALQENYHSTVVARKLESSHIAKRVSNASKSLELSFKSDMSRSSAGKASEPRKASISSEISEKLVDASSEAPESMSSTSTLSNDVQEEIEKGQESHTSDNSGSIKSTQQSSKIYSPSVPQSSGKSSQHSNKSLEAILLNLEKLKSSKRYLVKKQQHILKRRKEVEDLLEWRKKLATEEVEVREMEKKALALVEADKKKVLQIEAVSQKDEQDGLTYTEKSDASQQQSSSVKEVSSAREILSGSSKISDRLSHSSIKDITEHTVEVEESLENLSKASSVSTAKSADESYSESFESADRSLQEPNRLSTEERQKSKSSPSLVIKSPLVPRSRRRHDSSGSDDSFTVSLSETASDQSDLEGRIHALGEELKKRQFEATRLKKDQKRHRRDLLKQKEETLRRHIEAYDQFILQAKAELERELDNSLLDVSSTSVKPVIKKPCASEHRKKQPSPPDSLGSSSTLTTKKSLENIPAQEKDSDLSLTSLEKSESSIITNEIQHEKSQNSTTPVSEELPSDQIISQQDPYKQETETETFLQDNEVSHERVEELETVVSVQQEEEESFQQNETFVVKSSPIREDSLSPQVQSGEVVPHEGLSSGDSSEEKDAEYLEEIVSKTTIVSPVKEGNDKSQQAERVVDSILSMLCKDTFTAVCKVVTPTNGHNSVDSKSSDVSEKIKDSVAESVVPTVVTSASVTSSVASSQKDTDQADIISNTITNYIIKDALDSVLAILKDKSPEAPEDQEKAQKMEQDVTNISQKVSSILANLEDKKAASKEKTRPQDLMVLCPSLEDDVWKDTADIPKEPPTTDSSSTSGESSPVKKGGTQKEVSANWVSAADIGIAADQEWFEDDFGLGSASPQSAQQQQLLIEQYQQYFCRQIPNKPPPPYTPPQGSRGISKADLKKAAAPEPYFVVPHTEESIQTIVRHAGNLLYDSIGKGEDLMLLSPGVDFLGGEPISGDMEGNSRKEYQEFIFDLTKEIALELYNIQEVPSIPWMKSRCLSRKLQVPKQKEVFASSLEEKVCNVLCLRGKKDVPQKWSVNIGRKKQDFVDSIIIEELAKEEPDWIDYSRDEVVVKNQVSEAILNFLVDDTVQLIKEMQEHYKNRSMDVRNTER